MKLKPRSFAYMKGISGECFSPRAQKPAEGEDECAEDDGDDDDGAGFAAGDNAAAQEDTEEVQLKEDSWRLIDKRALSSVTPYADDLMYLDDRFQEIALILRIAFARQQKVTKQARGSDESAAGAGAYDRPRIFNVKEMEGKLRLASSKIAARIAATAAAGLKAPRLEEMRHRLALDTFEVNVVVYLVGVTISPTIKSIIVDQASYENRQATTGANARIQKLFFLSPCPLICAQLTIFSLLSAIPSTRKSRAELASTSAAHWSNTASSR
jgi:hypothetical protein